MSIVMHMYDLYKEDMRKTYLGGVISFITTFLYLRPLFTNGFQHFLIRQELLAVPLISIERHVLYETHLQRLKGLKG